MQPTPTTQIPMSIPAHPQTQHFRTADFSIPSAQLRPQPTASGAISLQLPPPPSSVLANVSGNIQPVSVSSTSLTHTSSVTGMSLPSGIGIAKVPPDISSWTITPSLPTLSTLSTHWTIPGHQHTAVATVPAGPAGRIPTAGTAMVQAGPPPTKRVAYSIEDFHPPATNPPLLHTLTHIDMPERLTAQFTEFVYELMSGMEGGRTALEVLRQLAGPESSFRHPGSREHCAALVKELETLNAPR